MTKFQEQARAEAEAGRVDISAVLLGWKIGASKFNNNMIVSPDGAKRVKVLAEVSDRVYKVDFNGKIIEIPAGQIATAIAKLGWDVGYDH